MLTGNSPFRGRSDSVVFSRHLDETRSSIPRRIPSSADALRDVVCRLMARYPKDRYQTARELLASLRPMMEKPKSPVRRVQDIHESLLRLGQFRNQLRPGWTGPKK
jgi:serine/threonine protein kinase